MAENHERHGNCKVYKDVVVAPNKNAGSLYMLLDEKQTPEVVEKVEAAYKAAVKDFNKLWKESGVDPALQNYRVGDDPRWKKD